VVVHAKRFLEQKKTFFPYFSPCKIAHSNMLQQHTTTKHCNNALQHTATRRSLNSKAEPVADRQMASI